MDRNRVTQRKHTQMHGECMEMAPPTQVPSELKFRFYVETIFYSLLINIIFMNIYHYVTVEQHLFFSYAIYIK